MLNTKLHLALVSRQNLNSSFNESRSKKVHKLSFTAEQKTTIFSGFEHFEKNLSNHLTYFHIGEKAITFISHPVVRCLTTGLVKRVSVTAEVR